MNKPRITRKRISELVGYLPMFANPAADVEPKWHGLDLDVKSGQSILPYPVYPPKVEEFFRLAQQPCWFDPDYESNLAAELICNDEVIANASLAQIRTMLTYCVRGERFCGGLWAAMIGEGRIGAILQRLQTFEKRRTRIDPVRPGAPEISTDELVQIFAQSIFTKVTSLKTRTLKSNQRKRLRKSIVDDIRAYGGCIFPDERPTEVSKAAHTEAERRQIKSIWTKAWCDQRAFDKGRKTFHLEHVHPISSIRNKCEMAESEGAVQEILKIGLRVAWILKSEDAKLTLHGFRSDRPCAKSAYQTADIELLEFSSGLPKPAFVPED